MTASATTTIDPEVLSVLRGSKIEGSKLYLPAQLERKLYERTNKVLTALGGKWNKGAKAHLFTRDVTDVIPDVLDAGEVTDRKKLLQQYYTPESLANDMVRRSGIMPGQRVLEPSAGHGAIALAIRRVGVEPTCVDVDEESVEHLRSLGFVLSRRADFLKIPIGGLGRVFDAIIMNPPFTLDQDIKHVIHAMDFLAPGGRLIAIMSPGFTFGNTTIRRRFREMLEERRSYREPLPVGAFTESGTNVNTVLVEI